MKKYNELEDVKHARARAICFCDHLNIAATSVSHSCRYHMSMSRVEVMWTSGIGAIGTFSDLEMCHEVFFVPSAYITVLNWRSND